jgi:serine/threonine protein kinase HipA of HipAB toxin-antitoxin module
LNQIIKMATQQTDLKNELVQNYSFLREMYEDEYFPDHLVDKGKDILVDLCFQIEQKQPKALDELYIVTQAATDQFNDCRKNFMRMIAK